MYFDVQSVSEPATDIKPSRYCAIAYASDGGIGLSAPTPLQLVLAFQQHAREQWNRDPSDAAGNRKTAAKILTGRAEWHVIDDEAWMVH